MPTIMDCMKALLYLVAEVDIEPADQEEANDQHNDDKVTHIPFSTRRTNGSIAAIATAASQPSQAPNARTVIHGNK